MVAANWYRFRGSERIVHDRVMSVCFIWAERGRGLIRSGGQRFEAQPGMLLRLPWAHDVRYTADPSDPFSLGTVHVVPHHDRGSAVVPRVAHLPGDPLSTDPVRQEGDEVAAAIAAPAVDQAGRRLRHLGEYAIARFASEEFDEAVGRGMAELISAEDHAWRAGRRFHEELPAAVRSMTRFIADNIARPVSVQDVARAGGCSVSTAERLFRRHLGLSVQRWQQRLRMEEATVLLRTSSLRVAEVARAVGYADPLYFSRVFRGVFGAAPTRFLSAQVRP